MKRLGIAALVLLGLSDPAWSQTSPTMIVQQFETAWNTSDARRLAGLFTSDADFVSPEGLVATGRHGIEAYYSAAFAQGYAGSQGQGVLFRTRALRPDLVVIDARFTILAARQSDGAPRKPETGIMVAIVRREGAAWRITALRENAGAQQFKPMP